MALFGSLAYFIAQRTLWLGRANNAWGPSRVWNSGTSFETQVPPASVDHLAASGTAAGDGLDHTVASVTLDRVGQWLIIWRVTNSITTNQRQIVTGYVAGASVASSNTAATTSGLGGAGGCFVQASYTNATFVQVHVQGDGSGTITGYIDAYFIPTMTNPN